MPWHALNAEQRQQILADIGIQAINVVQLHLVEKSLLARQRVANDRRARCADLQFVVVEPGPLDTGCLATGLNLGTVIGLEEVLPGDVQLVGEGPHIQQTFLLKRFAQRLGQAQVHLSAVDHRGGTAHWRWLLTEEQLLARPGVLVRAFVVEEDHFLFWVRR
ncbi:hypothetical protein D3C72_1536780 [compost metagenome]